MKYTRAITAILTGTCLLAAQGAEAGARKPLTCWGMKYTYEKGEPSDSECYSVTVPPRMQKPLGTCPELNGSPFFKSKKKCLKNLPGFKPPGG